MHLELSLQTKFRGSRVRDGAILQDVTGAVEHVGTVAGLSSPRISPEL